MSVNSNTQQLHVVKKRSLIREIIKYKGLLLIAAIPLGLFMFFTYVPMYGVSIAFFDYRFSRGLSGSEFVGLEYFRRLFASSLFLRVFRNTLILAFYRLIFITPAPIILALLLNEIRNNAYKRTVQTISYLPHFLSWVVVAGLMMNLLSPTVGIVNYLLGFLGVKPVNFLIIPHYFRGLVVLSSVWKEIGWGSIIYLAAIANLDPNLYEAAAIDGAGRFQRLIHITLPGMMSAVVIVLILRAGRLIQIGFDQIMNLYNPAVYDVGDILNTYAYRVGLVQFDYSYSTAINLFQNVLALCLLVFTNMVARRINPDAALW